MPIALDTTETRLLTRKEGGEWLRERYHVGSKSWLAAISVKGQGPAFAIVGKQALYDPNDLLAWINDRFLSAKAAKHSAPSHNQVVLSASPVQELSPDQSMAHEPLIEEPAFLDYFSSADAEAIEKGLRLAMSLGA